MNFVLIPTATPSLTALDASARTAELLAVTQSSPTTPASGIPSIVGADGSIEAQARSRRELLE